MTILEAQQHVFWRNKGLQATSFVLDKDDDEDQDLTFDAVPVLQESCDEEDDDDDYDSMEEGSHKKSLQKWAQSYPSLVRLIATHAKNKAVAVRVTTPSRIYAAVFGDDHKEVSDNDDQDAEDWLRRLRRLGKLLVKYEVHDLRYKISLSSKARQLGDWLEFQVELARAGRLPPSRAYRLVDSLGLCWHEDKSVWEANYQRLLDSFHVLFGKTRTRPLLVQDASLKEWIQVQILQGKGLDPQRRRLLRSLRRRLAQKLLQHHDGFSSNGKKRRKKKLEEWQALRLLCFQSVANKDRSTAGALPWKKRLLAKAALEQKAKKRRVQVLQLPKEKHVHETPITKPANRHETKVVQTPASSRRRLPILRLESGPFSPAPQPFLPIEEVSKEVVTSDLDWLFAAEEEDDPFAKQTKLPVMASSSPQKLVRMLPVILASTSSPLLGGESGTHFI